VICPFEKEYAMIETQKYIDAKKAVEEAEVALENAKWALGDAKSEIMEQMIRENIKTVFVGDKRTLCLIKEMRTEYDPRNRGNAPTERLIYRLMDGRTL
jgi:hypothetical protein